MINWIKKILGIGPSVPAAIEIVTKAVEAKPKPKKVTKPKTAAKVDLESMKKNELLAYAKTKKIKVSASLKKAELILAIKNG